MFDNFTEYDGLAKWTHKATHRTQQRDFPYAEVLWGPALDKTVQPKIVISRTPKSLDTDCQDLHKGRSMMLLHKVSPQEHLARSSHEIIPFGYLP